MLCQAHLFGREEEDGSFVIDSGSAATPARVSSYCISEQKERKEAKCQE